MHDSNTVQGSNENSVYLPKKGSVHDDQTIQTNKSKRCKAKVEVSKQAIIPPKK